MTLPERTVKFKFPQAKMFTAPDYDETRADHWFGALEKQTTERFVVAAEIRELRAELRQCSLKNSINARFECRKLAKEYHRRTGCPNYVCEDDPRYLNMFGTQLNPASWNERDQSLEQLWKVRAGKYALDRYDHFEHKDSNEHN